MVRDIKLNIKLYEKTYDFFLIVTKAFFYVEYLIVTQYAVAQIILSS